MSTGAVARGLRGTRSAAALAGACGVLAVTAAVVAAGARGQAGADVCGAVGANVPDGFRAGSDHTGVIDLKWYGAHGAPVTFYECVGTRPRLLGTAADATDATTTLAAAVAWSCDRQVRRFAGLSIAPDGRVLRAIASVRTPSCAHRFTVAVPAQAARGRLVPVRIVDGWRVGGITPHLCVTAPDGHRTCRTVPFAPSVATVSRRFRATSRGRWRVDLTLRGFGAQGVVGVGVRVPAPPEKPVLLATGDSLMQGVDASLSDALTEFTVATTARPGAEIGTTDWPGLARRQAARYRPSVTVVTIGGVEGYPFRTPGGASVPCCGEPWQAAYAGRVRAVMDAFRRGGRARVFYLTVPLPRQAARVPITRAVNDAILRAARGAAGVTVLQMDRLFTPDGYRETLRDGGRDVDVREFDGVHLNASGTSIAARETTKAVRGEPTMIPGGP